LMGRFLREDGKQLTILTATSGDTGSAVAHAFHNVPGIRVIVLFPFAEVSVSQRKLMTTLRDNVRTVAINGKFDDCQAMAKRAFSDPALKHIPLSSANSINIGRLLPQMIYYFHAVAQLPTNALVVSTPSGNFGNLTAGLMAKRTGLPVARFIAATNVNDVVPQYLSTGRFEPHASVRTLTNAMDVGNPSNFDRMRWIYNGDLDAMRRDIAGSRHDDDEVRQTIRRVYEERGYLLDPHSAIGYLGLQGRERQEGQERREGRDGIFLATAHPAKFAEVVEPIIGRAVDKPAPLADALARPRHVVRMPATLDALRDRLTAADL